MIEFNHGGMGVDQALRLKNLENGGRPFAEQTQLMTNQRLRQAVSDLTLEKQILAEATSGSQIGRAECFRCRRPVA